MTNYREILRLNSLGLNNSQIAEACGCSRTTVVQTLRLAKDKSLTYSVLYEYIKQKVDVRLTTGTIEVFFEGNRICSHVRLYGRPDQYSTVDAHMPPDHQQYIKWNGERFIEWAAKIGKSTETVIKAVL